MSKKAVLVDVDGTLIDSNDAHAMAWVETFEEFGHTVAFERIRHLIGKGGDQLLPEAVGIEKDSPEGKVIAKRRATLFKEEYLPNIVPFEGARALLEALHDRAYRLVVATSATEDEIGALLDVASIRDLVDDVKSSSDAQISKPDPDIVTAALAVAHCQPSEAVMLGDTPYDIEAASKANVISVAVRCGGWNDASLKGARAIYDDPRDLLTNLGTSPFDQQ
jgi:HAD superfamily hydrolase (TIGR01509 family)